MNPEYYKSARKWYNTIYVKVASERIIYFIVLLISIACFYYMVRIALVVYGNKRQKNTYIIMVKNHSNKDDMIKVTRASEYSHQSLNLLKFIIEKYVLNMETLQYDSTNTSSDAIKNKITIIKNLSRKDVYNNYIKNSYNSENGDISLAILKLKKIATIEKIEFIYDNLNIIEKFYSQLACPTTPKGAKVYFSSETTSEKNKKQYFVATLFFSFYIASQKKVNSTVEFKVNDYSVKMINKDDYSFNE